jgi:hypothetical protein
MMLSLNDKERQDGYQERKIQIRNVRHEAWQGKERGRFPFKPGICIEDKSI